MRDEHRLLGAVLATLARPRTLEAAHLPDALRRVLPPPTMHLDLDAPDAADLWPAIGGRFHPTLSLVVAASVDPDLSEATAPPPADIGLSVVDRRQPKRRDERQARLKTPDPR